MSDRGTSHRVSAGPYTLELPTNGVALLHEDGKRLPGGVGYFEALVQFAGEVLRLNAEIVALRAQQEAVRGIAGNERRLSEAIAQQARAAALEEAAQRCDTLATDYTIPVSADNWSAGCRGGAGRIRALKDKGDD